MILTITGSDSTGGSGVQADIKTIFELGGYAVSAITSITVQNTLGIQEFFDIPAEIVSGQIEAIMNDMQPDIVKIGMIRRVETLNVVIDALTRYRPAHIIYAPAIWSSQGDALMTEDVVSQIKYRLLSSAHRPGSTSFCPCHLSESGQEDGGGVGDGAGFHQYRIGTGEQSAGQEFRALQPVYLAGE